MFTHTENPTITIESLENGYVVTVKRPKTQDMFGEIINQFMPQLEKMTNKMNGDEWKNNLDDEINSALKNDIKPIRQFIAKDFDEVLEIVAKFKF